MNWAGFSLIYLFPLLTLGGSRIGGWGWWLCLFVAAIITPLLDVLIGQDRENPDAATSETLLAQQRYRWLLFGFVPVQLAMLLWACHTAASGALAPFELAGLLLSTGIIHGGLAINVAHELCHRRSEPEQSLAKLLWFSVGYLHFHIEHRLGHHFRVATPEDPASARLGESLYAFFCRSIPGGWRSAWRIERARLAQLGLSPACWRNQMLWFAALPPAFALALGGLWGWQAGAFYLAQSAIAILILELVNYLEHYGLERRRLADGSYERVDIRHSWNSSQRLTNYILLKLQRHADHHANPGRRYPILRHFEQSPQLPTGYGGMMILALFPPLWHRVMDPRVLAYRARTDALTGPILSDAQIPAQGEPAIEPAEPRTQPLGLSSN